MLLTEPGMVTADLGQTHVQDVRSVLAWLDFLLCEALACANGTREPEAGTDPFRGLHISPAEVARLLRQLPGEPLLASRDLAARTDEVPRPQALMPLVQAFGLDDLDLALLLIAAAPELDLRYERLFAYLQDDVNKKRPTVDLALNLLCGSLAAKLHRRAHFAADAPLIQHRLVHLVGEGTPTPSPLLVQAMHLDEQVLDALLGQISLDRRLAAFCRLLGLPELLKEERLQGTVETDLPAQVRRYVQAGEPLCLYLQGPAGADKDMVVQGLAREMGVALLQVDLSRLPATIPDVETALALVFREAWLKAGVLHLHHFDALQGFELARAREGLSRHLARATGVTILSGALTWEPLEGPNCNVIPVNCAAPKAAERTACWARALGARDIAVVDKATLAALGERFQLSRQQIEGAVSHAIFLSRGRAGARAGGSDDAPTTGELFLAAREQTRHVLAPLAQRIESTRGWDDLVLADDALAQMREICAHFAHRQRVMEDWGFGKKLPYGKGINVLFAGPSGTGKTMAAEVLANELKLDLYRIDLARVVSKYIGETEKNLDRIFTAAQDANAILFFDEADALFGKRSEVKDAHDRYANLEISYLLQKMEQYEGVTILASNLRQNLDPAFVRRLGHIVEFSFPDEAMRLSLWSSVWTTSVQFDGDFSACSLARQLKLSGGSIKNVALGAAFLAAHDGQALSHAHVLRAARREQLKTGRALGHDSWQEEVGGA